MAAAAILDWLGGYLDQSRIVIGGLYRYATFGWNRCSIFDNMEVLIFCTFGLKTLIQAPKIGVFGRYDSLNGVRYQRNPQKAHPWAERRRTTHRSLKSVYRCDLWACPRNQKRKKDKERNSTVANWIFAETTHVVGSKRRSAWWVVLGRLSFNFHPNRFIGFRAVGVANCPFPLHCPVAYTTVCTTVQAVIL